MLESWLQIAVTLLIALAISVPVGRYLSRVVTDEKPFSIQYWIQSTISSTSSLGRRCVGTR
jgi:K+-transporting ATPase A subunit